MRTASLIALLLFALGGCGPRTDVLVCEHCYCAPWGTRDVTHPISCGTLDRDVICCVADSS